MTKAIILLTAISCLAFLNTTAQVNSSNYPYYGGWQLIFDNHDFNLWNSKPLYDKDQWDDIRDQNGHGDYEAFQLVPARPRL